MGASFTGEDTEIGASVPSSGNYERTNFGKVLMQFYFGQMCDTEDVENARNAKN